MKGHFGMRRVHVRGKQAVHNDIGLMLMAMNLTKLMLELGRWTAQFSHHSTKKETQQILSQKKAGFCCVSFYLELVISQSQVFPYRLITRIQESAECIYWRNSGEFGTADHLVDKSLQCEVF